MTDQTPAGRPGADEPPTIRVHPGDIVQVTDQRSPLHGATLMIGSTHGWGVGCVLLYAEGSEPREQYARLKPGQFTPVGPAPMIPPPILRDRQASLAHDRELASQNRGNVQACPFCGDPMRRGAVLIIHVDPGDCLIGSIGIPIENEAAWNQRAEPF